MRRILLGGGEWLLVLAVLFAWLRLPATVLAALALAFLAWLLGSRAGQRALAVTRVGLGTLGGRRGAAAVIVIGIAGVVGVLVALLAMGEGLATTLRETGSVETAIVLRGGAGGEANSVLGREEIEVIRAAPGVARDQRGRPVASAEIAVVANVPRRGGGEEVNISLRGVGEEAWAVWPNVQLVEGRRFEPGLRELVAGRAAERQFAGLGLGQTLRLSGQDWTVVGIFASGDTRESELWGDARSVGSAYRRGSSAQSVTVKLEAPEAFAAFKAALQSDPRLKVDVDTTRDYFTRQSEGITRVIRVVGMVIGFIMAIGAAAGALNSMYAAVATRAREIATLRALGFGGGPVVVSVLLETLLLACLGGVLGAALVWLAFNGYTASTLGENFSQVVFEFRVTPELAWTGLRWALAIGFLGGWFPALRAARLPVATALRES